MYECLICLKPMENKTKTVRFEKFASDCICNECAEIIKDLDKPTQSSEYERASKMIECISSEVPNFSQNEYRRALYTAAHKKLFDEE